MYLWFKLLHVFFVISWFAGLFYLPRIYVNLAQLEPGSVEYVRLTDMSRRLYRFMSPLGWGTLIFGAAIGFVNNWWGNGWLAVKLLCGLLLLAYQLYCGLLLRRFKRQQYVFSPLVSGIQRTPCIDDGGRALYGGFQAVLSFRRPVW